MFHHEKDLYHLLVNIELKLNYFMDPSKFLLNKYFCCHSIFNLHVFVEQTHLMLSKRKSILL